MRDNVIELQQSAIGEPNQFIAGVGSLPPTLIFTNLGQLFRKCLLV